MTDDERLAIGQALGFDALDRRPDTPADQAVRENGMGPDLGVHIPGMRGLYVPMVGGFDRIVPNTPQALAVVARSILNAQKMLDN
jgi:hypothetical protein